MAVSKKEIILKIPKEISHVAQKLEKAGFEAYLIGGCVRDLILGAKPKDWDITTNAKPQEIVALFEESFYENDYGTVGVVNKQGKENEVLDETLKVVEVTPYRLEYGYSDSRHPDKIVFGTKIEDDLERRDFTINAIALKIEEIGGEKFKAKAVDLFGGFGDIKNKIIRAVGNPDLRFKEDALRLIRAVRIATEINFVIEEKTMGAILKDGKELQNIAKERIRDEFIRIIMSDEPMSGLNMLRQYGLMEYILPDLVRTYDVKQNRAHSYDVWEHLLRAVQHSAKKKWPLDIRISALLHDISKPETKRWDEKKKDWSFHGHDVVGSKVAKKILNDLKFPKDFIEKVVKMVRWHMFFSDTEIITLSAVRRLVNSVGRDNIWDLMNLRICDRVGTGRPKEDPYRLRKYKSMIEESLMDPISVTMLKINGSIIMEKLNLPAGPKIGHILHSLLEEVLDDPSKNNLEYLENKSLELAKMDEKKLIEIAKKGRAKKNEEEEKILKEIRKKYWVK